MIPHVKSVRRPKFGRVLRLERHGEIYVGASVQMEGRLDPECHALVPCCSETISDKAFRSHDLRHTFATRLVLGGVDIVTVKELLAHSDISTTMRYSHPSPESKHKWQMGRKWQTGVKRKSLIIMVPPRRLERPTNGLGRQKRMKSQLIDFAVIIETTLVCSSFELSIQFPSVSREPYTPDL